MGFIYKITNKLSGKCYIGETKLPDPEKRWKGHITSMKRDEGCPLIKNAFKKYGVENFKFEILIICFDEDRFEYEKEYIAKYKSQTPNGYNILPGGEGGGFLGKTHTEESRKKISENCKVFNQNNPGYFETYREKWKEGMKRVNLSEAVKGSLKYQEAVKEGRVGSKAHKNGSGPSEETKEKIRQGVLKYFESNPANKVNIEKHRESMTKAVGRHVGQYSSGGVLIKEYNSIAEAGRLSGVKSNNISSVLRGKTKLADGYIWKYLDNKGA